MCSTPFIIILLFVLNLRDFQFTMWLLLLFDSWLLVFFDNLLKLLFSQFLDCLLIVRHSSVNSNLFHLFLYSTTNDSIDCFLLVKHDSWWKIIVLNFLCWLFFSFYDYFGFKGQLIFVFFVLVINCWLVLSFF